MPATMTGQCPFSKGAAALDRAQKVPNPVVNREALKSEIRAALVDQKAFACPIAMRVAWHSAGTWDKNSQSGGTDGATMRYEPENSDGANAGLYIVKDMLHQVKKRHPEVSLADLWSMAGCVAVEFMGGPQIEHHFGRTDAPDASTTPENGRLPDALQGAQHLRDVFYRMGFGDKEIVALSGGHTVGRCHMTRSGFDGPWTKNSLEFDNSYFRNLLNLTWEERKWDGKKQYQDKETGELMMLPTDLALLEDAEFKKHVEAYAKDQDLFFKDFADAYARLMALGCPEKCQPKGVKSSSNADDVSEASDQALHGAEFRERAMHGSLEFVQKLSKVCDVHEVEKSSGRSALHKAAFWGHDHVVKFLLDDCKLDANVQDLEGDTAFHDACRFGHLQTAKLLLPATNVNAKNKQGQTPKDVALEYGKDEIVKLFG